MTSADFSPLFPKERPPAACPDHSGVRPLAVGECLPHLLGWSVYFGRRCAVPPYPTYQPRMRFVFLSTHLCSPPYFRLRFAAHTRSAELTAEALELASASSRIIRDYTRAQETFTPLANKYWQAVSLHILRFSYFRRVVGHSRHTHRLYTMRGFGTEIEHFSLFTNFRLN